MSTAVAPEDRNAFDDLPFSRFSGTTARELRNLKARYSVPYDPNQRTPQEAIAEQLDLLDTASHRLPPGISPATVHALISQINPDRLPLLKGYKH